jgi:hypothetical protein
MIEQLLLTILLLILFNSWDHDVKHMYVTEENQRREELGQGMQKE